mgnify:CR=1 FL=1
MQYHLNGFKPGNYQIPDSVRVPASEPEMLDLPKEVDVLIVGCGPAGLTLARQLAEFPDIKTCIVDLKSGPMLFGQADGISCRTMEIMEAFNSSQHIVKESYWLNQNAFWEPDSAHPERITRSYKTVDARVGLSEFPHVVINQARIHELLLEGMKQSPAQLEPHYSRRLLSLDIDPLLSQKPNAHPVTARFECKDSRSSMKEETIRANYIVGCDGARSAVRENLSIPLEGDAAHKAWGVMDILLVTDFPDIRVKSFIQSQHDGAVMIVPREGGYLVRLYVELDKMEEGQRAADLNLGIDDVIEKAQRIMNPYKLDVKEVAWWSIYEIRQRVAKRFDNTTADSPVGTWPRAFVAGDACHTHSAKGGQGLNVSMHDTFNLGWKLSSVLQGRSHPKILHSYSSERRDIAKELIALDKKLANLVATQPAEQEIKGQDETDTGGIRAYIAQQNGFIAGTVVQYKPSIIRASDDYQDLAQGFQIGRRFHSAEVIRMSDGKCIHLGHLNKADGRWRIFIFANNQGPKDAFDLVQFLANDALSPVRKYTPKGADIDAVIDVCAVFQQTLPLESLPEHLLPSKGKYGLRDYEKVYYAEQENDIFEQREVNRHTGCMVVVRPDQHIASVLPLNAYDELTHFFDAFMLAQ